MIENLYMIALILNVTGLFSFIAPQIGTNISTVSQILLLLNLVYLIYRKKIILKVLRKKYISFWIFFLLLWPLLSLIYAPEFNIRAIGLQVYYTSLFLGSLTFTYINGWHKFVAIFNWGLGITIFGLILSLVLPSYFENIALISNGQNEFNGRAFGFFMQPNQAAANIIFIFIVWACGLNKNQNLVNSYGKVLLLIVLVLITGSRGGLLTAICVSSIFLINRVITRNNNSIKQLSLDMKAVISIILCLSLCIIFWIGINNLESRFNNTEFEQLASRISSYATLNSLDKFEDDASVQNRFTAQHIYISRIMERPFLGRGINGNLYDKTKGIISLSSHNVFIEKAYEYGILYILLFLFILFDMYRYLNRKIIEKLLFSNIYLQAIIAILFSGLVSNTTLHSRTLITMLGGLISFLMFPKQVYYNFSFSKNRRNNSQKNLSIKIKSNLNF